MMLVRTVLLLWAVIQADPAYAQAVDATRQKPDLIVIGSIVSDQTEHLPSAVPSDAKGKAEMQRHILVRKLVIRVHRVVDGSVKSDLIEAKSVRTILSTSKGVPDAELKRLLQHLRLPRRFLADRERDNKHPLLKAWRFELARINNDPDCSADSPALLPRLEPGHVLGPEAIPCYRLLREGMQSVKDVFAAPEKVIGGAESQAPAQSKDQRVAVE